MQIFLGVWSVIFSIASSYLMRHFEAPGNNAENSENPRQQETDRKDADRDRVQPRISEIQKKTMEMEDSAQIENIRRELETRSVSSPVHTDRSDPRTSIRTEDVERDGQHYRVRYMPRSELGSAFGMAYFGTNQCDVREDLPPRVRVFVKEHELYHLRDPHQWGGWIGREIRANVVPGLKDPLGLLATVAASLSPQRIAFYLQRIRSGW